MFGNRPKKYINLRREGRVLGGINSEEDSWSEFERLSILD